MLWPSVMHQITVFSLKKCLVLYTVICLQLSFAMAAVLILTFFALGVFWIHSPLHACWLAPSFCSQPLVNPRTPSPPSPAESRISQAHTWKPSPDPVQPKAPPPPPLWFQQAQLPGGPGAGRQGGSALPSHSLGQCSVQDPHGLARKVKRIHEEKKFEQEK